MDTSQRVTHQPEVSHSDNNEIDLHDGQFDNEIEANFPNQKEAIVQE